MNHQISQSKALPILFTGAMVRAILDGRKTQTRRIMKPQPGAGFTPHPELNDAAPIGNNTGQPEQFGIFDGERCIPCPHGAPGDQLWVRETWMPFGLKGADYLDPRAVIGYKASNDVRPDGVSHEEFGASKEFACTAEQWREFKEDITRMDVEGDRWRPSIHMPRWASRITLEITGVRVERLQEISAEDAIAEGMAIDDPVYDYSRLWESINGEGSWDTNPYVWVIEFRRVESEVRA